MNKSQITHIGLVVASAALGLIADLLSGSHYVWAPVAIALAANVKTALNGAAPSDKP